MLSEIRLSGKHGGSLFFFLIPVVPAPFYTILILSHVVQLKHATSGYNPHGHGAVPKTLIIDTVPRML